VVSQSGSVLLVETVRKSGLDTAISAAMTPWRKPRTVHDPGKVLLDVALATALGGDCLADVAMLRAEPDVFDLVASGPTVSVSSTPLPQPGRRRSQRSARRGPKYGHRSGSWPVKTVGRRRQRDRGHRRGAGPRALRETGRHPTWKKPFGHHPLVAFVDHGQAGSGDR
jgi:hypothetical protein